MNQKLLYIEYSECVRLYIVSVMWATIILSSLYSLVRNEQLQAVNG